MTTYSPKEAQQILGFPASTVRRYRQIYANLLSVPDKSRRLTQDDIETLRHIRELSDRRFTTEEIEQIILDPPEQVESEAFDGEIPGEIPSAIQPVEFFNQVIDQLTDQHKEHINDLRREIDQLRADLEETRKPWWKRL